MDMSYFIKGLIIGFSIAAPVGPIGILCIRRTIQYGRFSGFVSGLGAAVADAVYAIVAAFGLTFISNFLIAKQFWFHLVGGIFLVYLGMKTFGEKPPSQSQGVGHTSLWGDFISTFFLTMTSPVTIIAFIAVFASIGFSDIEGNYIQGIALVVGVFLGAAFWWLILSEGVTLFRKKVSQKVMVWINRIAGMIILAFGGYSLFKITCCLCQ